MTRMMSGICEAWANRPACSTGKSEGRQHCGDVTSTTGGTHQRLAASHRDQGRPTDSACNSLAVVMVVVEVGAVVAPAAGAAE